MAKENVLKSLRDDDTIPFDKERYDHLTDEVGLYWRRAAALILSECGYSHSGIGNKLDVTSSTASGYLDDLEEQFGPEAIDSHPKHSPLEQLWPDEYENPFEDE